MNQLWNVSFLEMEKIKYRAVINFIVKKGITPTDIHSRTVNVYGDSSSSVSRGRENIQYDSFEGRPKMTTTPETIEKVHDMILEDRRTKVRKISNTLYTRNWTRKSFA